MSQWVGSKAMVDRVLEGGPRVAIDADPLDLGERVYLAVFHVLEPCLGQDRADGIAAELAEHVESLLTERP
jgi:hypothetical protein